MAQWLVCLLASLGMAGSIPALHHFFYVFMICITTKLFAQTAVYELIFVWLIMIMYESVYDK